MTEQTSHMRELITELNRASEAYYSGHEILTDFEWDHKFDELARLENETGIILPDSPTHNVSYEKSGDGFEEEDGKIKHKYPVLSLAKSKRVIDLIKWANNKPVWISYKLDGSSLVGYYDHGKLQKLITRGNGYIGQDVTFLAEGIKNCPLNISYKDECIVRGEALISYEDFDNFCLENGDDYKNPRNLVAGSLNLKDVSEFKKRNVTWIVYTLIKHGDDLTDKELSHWNERIDFLSANHFSPVPHELIKPGEMQTKVDKWTKQATTYKYPLDGLVIAYDDVPYSRGGTVTAHHATRSGFSLKWADNTAESLVTNLIWSCGATCITPVAQFQKVHLEGTDVTKASLANIDECERLGGIAVGDTVSVAKMNKIIPKIVGKVKSGPNKFTIPDKCPVCGAPTKIIESESGAHKLICTSNSCPGKHERAIQRFAERDAMDIDTLGPAVIHQFVNRKWITDYASIYHLKEHALEISSIDGFGAKKTRNLLDGIEKSRKTTGERLLYALSIPMCSKDMVKKLLSKYSFEELMDMLLPRMVKASEFAKIDGIGKKKAEALIKYFDNADNNMAVRRLLKEVKIEEPQRQSGGNKCANMTFCITGAVHTFKNRDEFKAYVESQGGKVSGSVSRKLTALVNNDAQSTSSKNRKAHELGVPIITEDEFIAKYGG